MTPPRDCRWGILGTSNIARKNWAAIRHAANATLTAVASRDKEKARRFIEECQASVSFSSAPTACGSYEELLARPDVDAVYLPLPTGVRKEWVLKAAAAGKHVVCEKPCGVNAEDVAAMLAACRENRVQFMDGVMFMHSRRLPLLRRTLDDSTSVGRVLRITSNFSFKASPEFLESNIRVQSDLEPLGALGDLGWYNIRISLWVMNEELPERVTGRILAAQGRGAAAVPLEFSGEMIFANDVSASFFCSFRAENQQWANISGTSGYAHVDDFVIPFYGCESAFTVNTPVSLKDGCAFNMENHTRRLAVPEYSNNAPDAQETRLFEDFSGIVLSGKLDPTWGEWALNTQRVLDACLRSARTRGAEVAVR